jgi:hypothetical protein
VQVGCDGVGALASLLCKLPRGKLAELGELSQRILGAATHFVAARGKFARLTQPRCPPSALRDTGEQRDRLSFQTRFPRETLGNAQKKQRPGWRGGNTQAAVRTKRQQTGRRGGTPSTCCLTHESCRFCTSTLTLGYRTVSA